MGPGWSLPVIACLLFAGCVGASGKGPASGVPQDPRPVDCRGPGAQGDRPQPRAVLNGSSVKTTVAIPSFDGHLVPGTLYRPIEANPQERVPILLHSHGWASSRTTADDAFRPYIRSGFGVLSFDMRGHGDARQSSEAHVDSMDYEIRDVRAVINYTATLDWVLLDGPQDPRVGALGGSYGGGYQLLTAAVDPRLDAIAPDITWNDLVDSLAPNGAVKSAWIDFLYGSGNLLARMAPEIHEGFSIAQSENRLADGSVPGEPRLKQQLRMSSASTYAGKITVPAFLSQGANDTLFSFSQAIANYDEIGAACRDVQLVTHLSGHILNTRGTIAVPTIGPLGPVGLQPPAGGTPCGNLDLFRMAFYQDELLGLKVDRGAPVCLSLEDGTTVSGNTFPLPETKERDVIVGAPVEVPQSVSYSTNVPLFTVDATQALVGVPHLRANITSPTPDAIVYFSFNVTSPDGSARTLNAQVSADRLGTMSRQPIDLALDALSAHVHAGDRVALTFASTDPQFAHNSGRVPGIVTFDDVHVVIPYLER